MVSTYWKGSFMKITTMCSHTVLCKNINCVGLIFTNSGSNQRTVMKLLGGEKSRLTSGRLSGGQSQGSAHLLLRCPRQAPGSQLSCTQHSFSDWSQDPVTFSKFSEGPRELSQLLTFIILEINTGELKRYINPFKSQ